MFKGVKVKLRVSFDKRSQIQTSNNNVSIT